MTTEVWQYLVEEVGGLHQLWAQGVEEHVGSLVLPVKPLGQGTILTPY